MNPAVWGATAALCWGTADFMGRFSARALGAPLAWTGVVATSALLLSLWVWTQDLSLPWVPERFWLLLAYGVSMTVATILLYAGLARGPIAVVAPIVGAFPVLVVALDVVLGAEPGLWQWLAMGAALLGVLIVARSAEEEAGEAGEPPERLLPSILLAGGAALGFAVAVSAGQVATPTYGPIPTLWAGRLIALAAALAYLLASWRATRESLAGASWTWAPFLAGQGLLDAAAYGAVLGGSGVGDNAVVAVVASTFGVVTVLLAWGLLRERIGLVQALGIALVFGGVAALTALG